MIPSTQPSLVGLLGTITSLSTIAAQLLAYRRFLYPEKFSNLKLEMFNFGRGIYLASLSRAVCEALFLGKVCR
jgi:hypothetical protein